MAICDSSAQPVVFQVPSGEITVLANCVPPSQPAASLPRELSGGGSTGEADDLTKSKEQQSEAPWCLIQWSPCGNFIAASCGLNCIAM